VRFLIYAQLPSALARFLADRGLPATHVRDVGLQSASDRTIWAYAMETGSALITKDEDFVTLRALSSAPAPAVIWIRIGNSTTRHLIARLNGTLPGILAALSRGETVIQVD
jgi:predicted nuclease of predicted toxin-antitoxin system